MRKSILSTKWYRGGHKGSDACSAIAAVIGWGKVIPHDRSWRVQYAMVIALLHEDEPILNPSLPPATLKHLEQIAEYYDVPICHSPKELKSYSKEYLRTYDPPKN